MVLGNVDVQPSVCCEHVLYGMSRAWLLDSWCAERVLFLLQLSVLHGVLHVCKGRCVFSIITSNRPAVPPTHPHLYRTHHPTVPPSPLQIITTLPHERFIINRERSSHTYRLSAYYLSKVLTEWPFRIAPIVLFCCIVYWPVQLQRTAAKFFLFMVNAVLEYTAMNAVGLLVSELGFRVWGLRFCVSELVGD